MLISGLPAATIYYRGCLWLLLAHHTSRLLTHNMRNIATFMEPMMHRALCNPLALASYIEYVGEKAKAGQGPYLPTSASHVGLI